MATYNTINNSVPANNFLVTGYVQINDDDNSAPAQMVNFRKSRLGGVITTGDDLGGIVSYGHDGTSFVIGSTIITRSKGTIATNKIPTDIIFATKSDTAAAIADRVVIGSEGGILINAPTSGTALTAASGGITLTAGDLTCTLGDIILTNGQISVGGSTGTNGQLLLAATGGNPAWGSITAGDGISLAVAANSLTVSSTAPFAWSAASADGTIAVNTGRFNTKGAAALLTMTLPSTAAVGTIIILQGSAAGNGGWLLAQNAGQNVQMGSSSTTSGAGGSLASTNDNDSISLVCTVADTTWNCYSSIGNITIV
jgi:hypothetical protein